MSDRRFFLRGLASLPLIGGSVAILGQPTAAAVPVTTDLLDRYSDWLETELGETLIELAPRLQPEHAEFVTRWRRDWCRTNGTLNPYPERRRFDVAPARPPSTRAAVILSTAGVPLTNSRRQ